MNREKKKKLAVLAVLALALLVSGTFAFTAFNQRAINDRLRNNLGEVGGRVHDYYNRDTENKDVFVENYGDEPIMARIRLSEFMEIQARGETSFTPVVRYSERGNTDSWTPYIPEVNNLTRRAGASAVFNQYANLTFGWTREEGRTPWYLPTFNHDENNLMTAAAGHARDYIAGAGATDGSTDGATHPGAGTDAYWIEDVTYTNGSQGTTWPGAADGTERTTAQNLPQDRAPMTLQQWSALPNEHKIGDFWVIDHETGWAYWASQLQVGETTSYLLDAAQMSQITHDIRGSYYYGIHVDSQLITPERVFQDEPDEGHDGNLGRLLLGIRNNAVEDSGQNPGANVDSSVEDFNFSTMNPGRIFTMEGEQYRYLEDMGDGNHMIIRNLTILGVTFTNQNIELDSWYGKLHDGVKAITRPVSIPNPVPAVPDEDITWDMDGDIRWVPNNLHYFPEVASDITEIDLENGTKQAFALSLADVTRLSGSGLAFNNYAQRISNYIWWLRTPGGNANLAWGISASNGMLHGSGGVNAPPIDRGIRPALIIHQNIP